MENSFIATAPAINVIAGNQGLTFTPTQLQAISQGMLVLSNPNGISPNCITHLRYQEGDKDLVQITLDNGQIYTNTSIVNLDKFRERLQEAANFWTWYYLLH